MVENMTESEAREKILAMVEEYYNTYHRSPVSERIHYAGRVYDADEMRSLVDSALDFWLTAGRYADEFEKGLAAFLGLPYCALVNSGSSANLLAFMALTAPELGERAIRRGDEIITVACAFPTTLAPIVQYGAIPVFVDVTIPQYNIDVSMLEAALSPATKAVFIAHTLGNPFDAQAVRDFCDRHGLWLIEDNCDALGSLVTLDGELRRTGTIGDIATSSFYPPHHITLGEGGAVYTRNPLLDRIVRSLRDWGRDCHCPSGVDNSCGLRFQGQYGRLPFGYDHKYVYARFGYNLKATEMQASIGCAQLRKLPGFIEKRRENFEALRSALSGVEDRLILPEALPGARPSWFGFPITCREGTKRASIIERLEKRGIQTRMLFAGNILRHPCFDALDSSAYRVVGELHDTERILQHTFWLGVYPGIGAAQLDRIAAALWESLDFQASQF